LLLILKKVRLHSTLLQGIEEALDRVFGQGKKSDQVVPAILKAHPKWGSRDRNFVAENTYEIVRNKRLILYCLDYDGPLDSGTLKKMTAAWLILKEQQDESDFFTGLDPAILRERVRVADPAVRFSVPDALNEYMIAELGTERWYRELEAMSTPAEVYLRVNLNRISREKLREALLKREMETETVEGVRAALRLLKRANLTATDEFRKGMFEIQDAGSQLIGGFLNPVPGSMVVDACAGAGGKALHLADLMQNKGQILAMDVEAAKLQELQNRAVRNKVSIIQTALVSDAVIQEYRGKADYLLLDVPCSGSGVIRRNPDAKEKLTPEFMEEIREVQQHILQNYSTMLKPEGKMVYATCSLLPSENRGQVDRFMEENKGFVLVEDRQVWPSETGFDGFYMALITRE